MNLRDFANVLRARWTVVAVTTLVAVIGSVALSLLTTPLYQASTRLFVSTTAGASATELYQGNRLSQDRVASYTELVMGETLAQRVIDKLDLNMTAKQLKDGVKATTKLDTVLIDVSVLDQSPVRARDIANAVSDEFVLLVSELETPKPGATPDARVVVEQRATIPTEPVIPKKLRNLVMGLGLGLLGGVGLALLRDQLDNTIKDRETLEEITGVGLVGSIPLDKERRRSAAVTFDKDNSAIAEAFRKLRTNLKFLGVDNPPRVIAITSSTPAEGKSTTAINIALALAEADHNVVLVDSDMRRPALAKYLGLVGSVGFSTVLSGAASLADVLQPTKFQRLKVITAGTSPPNPSELLGSLAAQKFIDELRTQFDYVIVDSSPLLAVTDAAILATNCDGVLVISHFGKTRREHLTQSIRSLEHVGATILGAVFTMTPSRGSSDYSYNYSYYGGDREQHPASESISPVGDGSSSTPDEPHEASG